MRKEAKISNFVIARRILEVISYFNDTSFEDLCVSFESNKSYFDHNNNVICLSKDLTLPKTIYSIVSLYIDNMRFFCERPIYNKDNKDAVKNFTLALVRDISSSGNQDIDKNDASHLMRMDQFPVAWTLLKSLICPFNNLPLDNIQILAGSSGKVDGSVLVDKDDPSFPKKYEEPFIFLNLDVDSPPVRSGFLLVEYLKYACKESNSERTAIEIMRSVLSEFYLRDKVVNFIKMAYDNEEEAADFFAILSILCNSEDMENIAVGLMQQQQSSEMTRTAQGMDDNWWFLGLIEKMLDPARSEDWEVYEKWKPITEELWAKVESERRKRGLDEVPFEMLLRIMVDDQNNYETDDTRILQNLLSNDRIW